MIQRETVVRELELLSGKVINGDLTPVVYEMVKESIEEGKLNVCAKDTSSTTKPLTSSGRLFADWLRSRGEVVAVSPHRHVRKLSKNKQSKI